MVSCLSILYTLTTFSLTFTFCYVKDCDKSYSLFIAIDFFGILIYQIQGKKNTFKHPQFLAFSKWLPRWHIPACCLLEKTGQSRCLASKTKRNREQRSNTKISHKLFLGNQTIPRRCSMYIFENKKIK